ncbi:serine hydrolase domain-containing protein [Bacteroidota bacterium]
MLILFSCSFNSDESVNNDLQRVLDKALSKHNVKGVSASIIYPDWSVWNGVSGISYDTVSIEPDMLYAIGSITKNFVASLTFKLIEEGILALDDPISKWLSPYNYIDSTITIRQLLNHTSGIYMFFSNQQIWDDLKKDRTKVWRPDEVLDYIKEPYFDPGEGFRYSNTNYLLLAMIIEKITGSTLSSQFKKYFWQPLDIKHAYLSIQEDIPNNQAHVFGDNFNNDGSYMDLTLLPRASHESIGFGSSGLFMTAHDLAYWCQSLFEGKILSKQSISEILKFVPTGIGGNMDGYGLGVQRYRRQITHGQIAYGHSGANIGTSASMVYLPDYHISVVVMINDMNHDCTETIVKKIIDILVKNNKNN